MASSIVVLAVASIGYYLYLNITGLLRHIAAAKRSGLPYVVSPVSAYNRAWLLSHRLFIPLFEKLPERWTEDWLPYMDPNWTWTLLHDGFIRHGDVFLSVSPGALHIYVADAEAIRQITARREAFPKPLESYKVLDIFGRNILTTEGAEWKLHRRISAPGFTEKNNILVFSEAIRQAQGMLRKWNAAEPPTLKEVPMDTARLTLHIISRVGFGVGLLWPGEKANENQTEDEAIFSSSEPAPGHTMSFETALSELLETLFLVLLVPKGILKMLPFHAAKQAYESYVNWRQYMNELFAQKVDEAKIGKTGDGMDIMGSLARSSYGNLQPGKNEKADAERPKLSDSDILGNAFIMLVAGHETTANAVHFALMELAISPRSQRLLQEEVISLFGNRSPETWDYDTSINAMLGGALGAVLNEVLRLMPPVIVIPKRVTKSQDQQISLDGKQYNLPAGAQIALCVPSAHRNPKYWPTQPSKITNRLDDLEDFRPERWLKANGDSTESAPTRENEDDFGGFTGEDTSSKLFRPTQGSFLPFSEGPRSCLGRRLAQVEVMALLAVIFQEHSVELAVDEWATDNEVAKMSNEERKEIYVKAQQKARLVIRSATSRLTLKLHDDPAFIPIRLVKKGEERFTHNID